MFQSCSYDNYLWRIIDDAFVETAPPSSGLYEAVVRVYEKRKLNVAANLFRAIVYHCNTIQSGSGIDDELFNRMNLMHPWFGKYKDELEKYLLLM